METPKYQLKEENHYGKRWISSRGVHVELDNGLMLGPAAKIAGECIDYSGEIRISNGTISKSAKSIRELLELKADHGTNLDILVEQGENAQRIAKRLSQGLRTKAYLPDFGGEE